MTDSPSSEVAIGAAHPRVLVVGAGSIGMRHVKNLLSLGADVSVYRYRTSRTDELYALESVTVVDSIEEGLDRAPDAVVVANSSDQHVATALAAARAGRHLFIEKPLGVSLQGVDELRRHIEEQQLMVEVGCMLRFHPTLRELHRLVTGDSLGRIFTARAWVGQHLAEWRPGSDYRNSYSASLSRGGGVLLDLIHEIDYLLWMLGSIDDVFAFAAHLSDLETDAEDVVVIQGRFSSGALVQIQLDCVSPIYRRGCEIVGSAAVAEWDYASNHLSVRGADADPPSSVDETRWERNQMYMDHMKYFLTRLRSGAPPAVGFDESIDALRVALAARASAASGATVSPSLLELA